MRFWIAGPRMFGGLIRPGISFSPRYGRASAPPMSAEAPAGFVYVIRGASDHRKIGVSATPQRRLSELQTGSPVPLTMEFCAPVYGQSAYSVEGETHGILAAKRLSGEWFDVPLNIAVAAVYGAAERAGASMQPRQTERTTPPVLAFLDWMGWLGDVLIRIALAGFAVVFFWLIAHFIFWFFTKH